MYPQTTRHAACKKKQLLTVTIILDPPILLSEFFFSLFQTIATQLVSHVDFTHYAETVHSTSVMQSRRKQTNEVDWLNLHRRMTDGRTDGRTTCRALSCTEVTSCFTHSGHLVDPTRRSPTFPSVDHVQLSSIEAIPATLNTVSSTLSLTTLIHDPPATAGSLPA